jgi:hypothetical protein
VFKQGYYHHLEEVDTTADRLAALMAMVFEVAASPSRPSAAPDPHSVSLDEQIDYFLASYPGGFQGEAWRAEHRSGAKRSLKSHRDPAVALAKRDLAQPALDSFIDEYRDSEGLGALCGVLSRTDLVGVAHFRPLTGLRGDGSRAVVSRLRDLLWGEEPLSHRFARWVSALALVCGRGPSWELVTAPLALVHPDDHVCVRTASFQAQASWMAPQLRFGLPPLASVYARSIAMAQRIRQTISERGAPANDLLDIHDFIGFTRGTKASAGIIARRPPASPGDA